MEPNGVCSLCLRDVERQLFRAGPTSCMLKGGDTPATTRHVVQGGARVDADQHLEAGAEVQRAEASAGTTQTLDGDSAIVDPWLASLEDCERAADEVIRAAYAEAKASQQDAMHEVQVALHMNCARQQPSSAILTTDTGRAHQLVLPPPPPGIVSPISSALSNAVDTETSAPTAHTARLMDGVKTQQRMHEFGLSHPSSTSMPPPASSAMPSGHAANDGAVTTADNEE